MSLPRFSRCQASIWPCSASRSSSSDLFCGIRSRMSAPSPCQNCAVATPVPGTASLLMKSYSRRAILEFRRYPRNPYATTPSRVDAEARHGSPEPPWRDVASCRFPWSTAVPAVQICWFWSAGFSPASLYTRFAEECQWWLQSAASAARAALVLADRRSSDINVTIGRVFFGSQPCWQ